MDSSGRPSLEKMVSTSIAATPWPLAWSDSQALSIDCSQASGSSVPPASRGSRYESGAGTARMCGPSPSGGGNTVLICATAVVLP